MSRRPGTTRTALATLRHPDVAAAAARFVATVLRDFFWLQFSVRLGLRRLPVVAVDHPLDASVPFVPAEVDTYLDFVGFWIRPLGAIEDARARREATAAFLGLLERCYAEASGVYRHTLSTTRRPRHLRGRFLVIHAFDPHLLCLPSLHVMIVTLTWVFHRRLDARTSEDLFAGAVAITESVLYVKQHSVNCVPAALHALGRLVPGMLSDADVEAFTSALFRDDPRVAAADAAAIREHIRATGRALAADGAGEAEWQPALVRFLDAYPAA